MELLALLAHANQSGKQLFLGAVVLRDGVLQATQVGKLALDFFLRSWDHAVPKNYGAERGLIARLICMREESNTFHSDPSERLKAMGERVWDTLENKKRNAEF